MPETEIVQDLLFFVWGETQQQALESESSQIVGESMRRTKRKAAEIPEVQQLKTESTISIENCILHNYKIK